MLQTPAYADIAQINDAYERMIRGDVKYRFVIDTSTLSAKEA